MSSSSGEFKHSGDLDGSSGSDGSSSSSHEAEAPVSQLTADHLVKFARLVAAKASPSDDEVKAVFALVGSVAGDPTEGLRERVFGKIAIINEVLKAAEADFEVFTEVDSGINLEALKRSLFPHYKKLLVWSIDQQSNVSNFLVQVAEAKDAEALRKVLRVPELGEEDCGPIGEIAQARITTILSGKIDTVPANKLYSLNMIIVNSHSVGAMRHAMKLAHDDKSEPDRGVEFAVDRTLTDDQYAQLVKAAKAKAKSLVQDKLKAAYVPVGNLDEEKTVFNALIAVVGAPDTLAENAAALKLTAGADALNAEHVKALDPSVYEAEAIKADALKLAGDFIVAKLNALDLAADNEALLRELQAALGGGDAAVAAANVDKILGEGFEKITADHLADAGFRRVISKAVDEKVHAINNQQERAFSEQVNGRKQFSDELKDYLGKHADNILRHQRERGGSPDLFKSLAAAKDPRKISKELIELGVPAGDAKDLDKVLAAQVEFIQEKAGEAVDSRLAGVRQERGHMWMPGGHKYENKKWAIGTSCSNFVAIGSYIWGKWGPSGGLDESRARTFLQGAAVVTGVVVAEAIAAPALLLATVWEAGRYAAITPLKAAAQYSTKRDFPEIDQSIALLQAELEAADRNPEATISPKVLASVEEQYTRLKELKLRYQNRGKKDDNVDVEACTRRLTKIEALKARVLVLKADPGEYIFKTKVSVVDMVDMKEDGGNEALYGVMRALEGVGAAGGAVPSIRGAGEVKDDKDKSLSKGDFKSIDATHVLLVKMDVGPEQTSWAVCREEKGGKPVVSVYNHGAPAPVALPEGAAPPSVPDNNYDGLKRKDFEVIAWAVELVNIYLERPGSNKDAIEITPGSGPQALTHDQIDALYIYCYRQGIRCEPTGLNSLCSKEVRANMDKYAKEQSTVIEKHFTSTHGPELKAGLKSDATDKERTDREDVLAKKAKYLSKSEREHVLEKGEKGRTLSSVFKRRI